MKPANACMLLAIFLACNLTSGCLSTDPVYEEHPLCNGVDSEMCSGYVCRSMLCRGYPEAFPCHPMNEKELEMHCGIILINKTVFKDTITKTKEIPISSSGDYKIIVRSFVPEVKGIVTLKYQEIIRVDKFGHEILGGYTNSYYCSRDYDWCWDENGYTTSYIGTIDKFYDVDAKFTVSDSMKNTSVVIEHANGAGNMSIEISRTFGDKQEL